MPRVAGLMNHVKENLDVWKKFYNSPKPFEASLPNSWGKLEGLEKLVLLRCFRMDKVSLAVRSFIEANLGKSFTEIPQFDLSISYGDSASNKPLIFILSPGSDPLSVIDKLAASMLFKDRLKVMQLEGGVP